VSQAVIAQRVVLLVDDSEATRFLYSNWLRRAGYLVYEAATGKEAQELLTRVRFDVALLDVNLPDMTGYDVCAHIKSTRSTAALPVLHVSATATRPEDRSTGLRGGADGYLVEPVEREELLATVIALTRYHDARRASDLLAARLEQLHQTTLLVNASANVTDLIRFAATGAAAIFGTPASIMAVRDGAGWMATARPDGAEPSLHRCSRSRIEALGAAAQAREPIDVSALADAFPGEGRRDIDACAITTPRGERIGLIALLRDRIESGDELILDHFSQALAVAVENQRLYSVEHRIALTLQHAMLPQSLPRPPYLDLAVRYQASSDTIEIGGDFYEVIELDESTTLLAIGDVVGHSLRAATVMAELRYTLRAFAGLGMRAGELLSRLSANLASSHPDLHATVCVAEVDRAADEIRITNAGHIPPFVLNEDGGHFVEEHGPMLAFGVGAHSPTVTLPFHPGDLVVLATDGLLERRDESIDTGLERLRNAVLRGTSDAAQLCDRVLDEVGPGEAAFDDIAMVVAIRRDH
jgi:serine phosphatase RsbU (regulator of sigma subunit)/CheY-like chemotaxis protein